MKGKYLFWLFASLMLAVLTLSACSTRSTKTISIPTTPISSETEMVQILDSSLGKTEAGTPLVTGAVKNVSTSMLAVVGVLVEFYDSDGAFLGTSIDSTNNDLGPDEIWSFVIIYFGNNPEMVNSYKVEITSPK